MTEGMEQREPPEEEPTKKDESEDDDGRKAAESRWEWVAACISFILVAGAIAFLVREGLGNSGHAPAITIEIDSIVPAGSGFLVEFHARNDGDRTAASLLIEGVLRNAAEEEVSSVTLDYLPGGSERAAGLFFSRDPGQGTLTILPRGYQRP